MALSTPKIIPSRPTVAKLTVPLTAEVEVGAEAVVEQLPAALSLKEGLAGPERQWPYNPCMPLISKSVILGLKLRILLPSPPDGVGGWHLRPLLTVPHRYTRPNLTLTG